MMGNILGIGHGQTKWKVGVHQEVRYLLQWLRVAHRYCLFDAQLQFVNPFIVSVAHDAGVKRDTAALALSPALLVQQVFDTLEASEAGALGTCKPAGEYPRLRKEVEDSKHRIWNGSHMPPYSLDGFRQYLLDAAHSKSIVSTGGGGGWGGASAYIRPAA